MTPETRINPAHLRHTTRADGGQESPKIGGFFPVVFEAGCPVTLSASSRNVIARHALWELDKVCGRKAGW